MCFGLSAVKGFFKIENFDTATMISASISQMSEQKVAK